MIAVVCCLNSISYTILSFLQVLFCFREELKFQKKNLFQNLHTSFEETEKGKRLFGSPPSPLKNK